MSFYNRQFSSSPVMSMPRPFNANNLGPASFGHSVESMPIDITLRSVPRTSTPLGRKRSRDEAADNLETADLTFDAHFEPTLTNHPIGEHAWPTHATQKNQSGCLSTRPAFGTDATRGETQTSRKLQRKESTQDTLAQQPTPVNQNSPSQQDGDGIVVDRFTMQLGIGWRRISDDPHVQAAARGWARYIENHYPVSNVAIILESKSLQSYLAETGEGYFLFAENLRDGQFVSATLDGTLSNLQSSPPRFEGCSKLMAADSPAMSDITLQSPTAPFTPGVTDIMMG